MLMKQTLASGKLDNINIISQIESQVEEKTRLELEIYLPSGVTGDVLRAVSERVINPANNTLRGRVDPWPENKEIVTLDGRIIRARWYKNPLFWSAIWNVLRPLLWAALVATILYAIVWVLNKYFPAVMAQGKGYLWLLVAGVGLIVLGPFLMQLINEPRYYLRYY